MSLTNKLETFQESIRNEAIKIITDTLKQRGTGYELVDPAIYDEEIDDSIYELPRGSYVGKYDSYNEFPIVMVNISETEEITFTGIPCLSENDDDYEFDMDELSTSTLCAIADIISDLEK